MDTILIIQDSPAMNKLLTIRLTAEGFSVNTTETGEEGIAEAQTGRYQVILLDYELPGLKGVQVAQILKKDEKTKDIPILFMSAKDEDELAALVKVSGAQGYICMPFQKEEFIDRIKSAIKR